MKSIANVAIFVKRVLPAGDSVVPIYRKAIYRKSIQSIGIKSIY